MARTTTKKDEATGITVTDTGPSRLETFQGILTIVVGAGLILYLFLASIGGLTYWLWGNSGIKIFLIAFIAAIVGLGVMGVMWLGSHMAIKAGTSMANAVTRHDVMDAYGDMVRMQNQAMPHLLGANTRQQLVASQQARAMLTEARHMAGTLQPLPPEEIDERPIASTVRRDEEDLRF